MNQTNQILWDAIDQHIVHNLIPHDPILEQTLHHTEQSGFPDHLAVAANQGMLLQMLVQMNQCKRVLELGTYAAYSTLWLARGLPDDGYILTIEGRDTHAALGQHNINQAHRPQHIDLIVGRAADVLQQKINEGIEPFDFIFIDADKERYADYLELSIQLAHSGTVIVMDNVIRAGDILNLDNQKPSIVGLRQLFEKLHQHPRLNTVTALQTVGCKGHDGFAIAIVK